MLLILVEEEAMLMLIVFSVDVVFVDIGVWFGGHGLGQWLCMYVCLFD